MKNWKFAVKPLCAVAALMFASVSYGQKVTIFVGSSGAVNSFGVAGITTNPIAGAPAPPCIATDGGGGQALSAGQNPYHLWTAKSNSAIDPFGADRTSPQEAGNLWVEWDNSAAPTVVCAYLSVDSVVGNRMLFGTAGGGTFAHATLGFTGDPAVPTATSCLGGTSQAGAAFLAPYLTDDAAGLPCTVYTLLSGKQFAAAVSDIRPEDAEYATQRAAAPFVANLDGLGYQVAGNACPGQQVESAWTNTTAQVVCYTISGTDPETGANVLGGGGYTVNDVGAYPVMVFYSLTPTAGGCGEDFANLRPNNVPHATLALIYEGLLGRTTDLGNSAYLLPTQSAADGGAGLNGCAMTVINREPISGTFNTFEFQVPRVKEVSGSQEQGVGNPTPAVANPWACAAAGTANPFYKVSVGTSTRSRVIGTGEMVKVVDGAEVCAGRPNQNALGYAFFTFSTYSAAAAQGNLRYLQVDGVDPIQTNYSAPVSAGGTNAVPAVGQFPGCGLVAGSGLPCRMPFTGLRTGGYRVWNIIREITATNPALDTAAGAPTAAEVALANTITQVGQDQSDPTVGNLTDFVPFKDDNGHILTVFRSHYNIANYYLWGNAVSGDITSGTCANGTNPFAAGGLAAYADNCGDMAGAIFLDQNDMDYLNDFGNILSGANFYQQ